MTGTIEDGRPKPRRTPILVVLAFNVALLLSPFAAMLSVVTYAPRMHTEWLVMTVGFAVVSLALLALIWRWLPWPIRVVGGLIVLLSCFALGSVASRCL